MWPATKISQLLNIQYPIIQAPMVGATTAELIAAVSNAGGLGSLGAALMTPEQIRQAIREIRALTNKPFNINLFIPEKSNDCTIAEINKVNALYDRYRGELNIPISPHIQPAMSPDFAGQIAVITEEKIPVFSFTFGLLPEKIVRSLQQQNIKIIGTATTVREAKLLAQSGVDLVVAQGSEAGGHRGSAFDTPIDDALIGTMALVPQIIDQIKIPVIASGGIMNGRGIVAALALGADAVQLGTAFLTCPESSIHAQHRAALLNGNDESTRLTRTFTGKTVRAIKNRLLLEMMQYADQVLPFYTHRAMLKDIQLAAAQQNKADFLSLWSGQAASLCRPMPAAKLVKKLVLETEKVLNDLEK